MLEIVCNKLEKSFGNKKVLKNINFEIKTNEKVALIGQNGCGKTTLLKLIAKEDVPTSGDIFIKKDSSIGLLNQQQSSAFNEWEVQEIIHSSFEKINKQQEKLKQEEERMLRLEGKELEKSIVRYTRLQEEFMEMGGYEVESKIDKLVAAFKIENLLDKKYKNLSGGEKTIVNLVCLLLVEPDILLLDEPTNHLDIDMIEWLENFLSNRKKTVVIVSHDRYFLDKVTNKTILIDNGEEEIFHGNYSYYLEENEKRILLEFNAYKNQQKQIEAMKKSYQTIKRIWKTSISIWRKILSKSG